MDIVKHYNVDGIHFDYIRYPNESYDYGKATLTAFCADMRKVDSAAPSDVATQATMIAYAKANDNSWGDWRRQQVTTLVEDTCRDGKAIRPNLICSAAVFADWKDAYINRGQDWHRWLADGALDAVVPMAYSADTAIVASQIAEAETVASAAGRFCYAGLGAWHISGESAVQKIQAVRALGAQGFVLFSYGGVTSDGSSTAYLNKVFAATFQHPAILPQMSWIKPATPSLNVSDSNPSTAESSER